MKTDYSIPKSKIIERLRFDNPWWITNEVSIKISSLPRRQYFNIFYKLISNTSLKRSIILMGPRRVGKTVMMHQAIDKLIGENINPKKIYFIGIDNPLFVNLSLEDLLQYSFEASGNVDYDEKYVFFDEIQYLNDWERHLKIMTDSYPEIKFIASGSAAAALKLKSTESGAGRFHDFILPPLTFHEFIDMKNKTSLIKPDKIEYKDFEIDLFDTYDIKELNKEFIDYLNYGGYPELLFSKIIQENIKSFVKNDIIDKVLLRDLPSLYGIKDVQELNRFFVYLAYNTGKEFSLEKISKESGFEKKLIKKYIEYLESAFLLKVINKVDNKAKYFKRITSFKIYLTNPSLRTALFSPLSSTDDDIGNVVETAIFSQWMHRDNFELFYSKWKQGRKEGEVDMIKLDLRNYKPHWALEIKWSNRYYVNHNELKSLIKFCNSNELKSAVVTSIDKEGLIKLDDLNIHFIPSSVYAYSIGASTIT